MKCAIRIIYIVYTVRFTGLLGFNMCFLDHKPAQRELQQNLHNQNRIWIHCCLSYQSYKSTLNTDWRTDGMQCV